MARNDRHDDEAERLSAEHARLKYSQMHGLAWKVREVLDMQGPGDH